MTQPIDNSTLGPIKIDPSAPSAMHTARRSWWTALTSRGDPLRIGNLAMDAFEAGWHARGGADIDATIDRQRTEADEWFRRELDYAARRP